ncbi:MAG: hypothetical protein KIC92_09455 [Clostridiales bacterium]|nr:hypothetical protein [Clostridiales bacterium]
MKRLDFIFLLVNKSEELRRVNSRNRVALEIYSQRSNYSVEIRHYYNNGLKRWLILTSDILENDVEQQKIIEYINQIK